MHHDCLWHCDSDGACSMYDVTVSNDLRGVQETDADGKVTGSVDDGCATRLSFAIAV